MRISPLRPGQSAAVVEAQLEELVGREALLLQPFVPSIQARGEVTVVMIDGQHTHAVRKIAAEGDFRVQDDHGGRVVAHEADAAERALSILIEAKGPKYDAESVELFESLYRSGTLGFILEHFNDGVQLPAYGSVEHEELTRTIIVE